MPKSRSLRESMSDLSDSISEGIGDAVDSVKGTYQRARARDSARAPTAPSAPVVRGSSNRDLIRDSVPDAIKNRNRFIDKAVDDNS